MPEYNCSHCRLELPGKSDTSVYCELCHKTYKIEWGWTKKNEMYSWLTGKEFDGFQYWK